EALATDLSAKLLHSGYFYSTWYSWAQDSFEASANYLYFLADVVRKGGSTDLADILDTQTKVLFEMEEN
ncbi:MAG: hypothetical protein KIG19_02760, partial [Bacteroidales bacterium]|nr:hypothetical protein [Bacteroidales bacterium]